MVPISSVSVPLRLPVSSRAVPTVQVSTAVSTTGMVITTTATSTAEPTVAFGLKRMIRNAAS